MLHNVVSLNGSKAARVRYPRSNLATYQYSAVLSNVLTESSIKTLGGPLYFSFDGRAIGFPYHVGPAVALSHAILKIFNGSAKLCQTARVLVAVIEYSLVRPYLNVAKVTAAIVEWKFPAVARLVSAPGNVSACINPKSIKDRAWSPAGLAKVRDVAGPGRRRGTEGRLTVWKMHMRVTKPIQKRQRGTSITAERSRTSITTSYHLQEKAP